MNKERLQKVIDAIKSVKDGDPLGFNMDMWIGLADPDFPEHCDKTGHECGSVACIAGWAHSLSQPEVKLGELLEGDSEVEGRKWLDLNHEEAQRLFLGGVGKYDDGWDNFEALVELGLVTQADALKVLEHTVATGDIDWTIIEDFDNKVEEQ